MGPPPSPSTAGLPTSSHNNPQTLLANAYGEWLTELGAHPQVVDTVEPSLQRERAWRLDSAAPVAGPAAIVRDCEHSNALHLLQCQLSLTLRALFALNIKHGGHYGI